MADRSSTHAIQTGGKGTFPPIERENRTNEDAASRRRRIFPFLLGRLDMLRHEHEDLPLQEIDLFLRGQPAEERSLAFDELVRAVADYPHLAEIVRRYSRVPRGL